MDVAQDLLKWALAALVIMLAIAGVIIVLKKGSRSRSSARWPLYAKRLLGDREQTLYWRLTQAFPESVVLAQVSFSQLLGVEKGAPDRQAISNRYRQLTADFVICRRSFIPVAVIELDGLSHDRPRRQEADERKALALRSVGIPLVRVNVADIPDTASLRRLIEEDEQDSESARGAASRE